jgi:hypothetical protein
VGHAPPVAKAGRAAKAGRERAANHTVSAEGRAGRINAVAAGRLAAAPVEEAVRNEIEVNGATEVRAGRSAVNNRARCPS